MTPEQRKQELRQEILELEKYSFNAGYYWGLVEATNENTAPEETNEHYKAHFDFHNARKGKLLEKMIGDTL